MATETPKRRSTLAWGLVITGMALFSVEQFGLDKIEGPTKSVHLDQNLISALVVVPFALIVAGAIMFVVGRMRRR